MIVDTFKTILASVVIEHLQKLFKKENKPILYLYIDENDPTTQTPKNLLGSLLKQLMNLSLPKDGLVRLRDLYHKTKSHGAANQGLIVEVLQQVISTYETVYIIVEALNQFPPNLRDKVKSILVDLQSHGSAKLSILITTGDFERRAATITCDNCERTNLLVYHHCKICNERDYDLCQECRLQGVHKSHEMYECAVDVEIRTKEEDLKRYIQWEIEKATNPYESLHLDSRVYPDRTGMTEFGRICSRNAELREEIIQTVTNQADGNILVARLYMDELKQALSRGEINVILDDFPEKLDTKYDIAMKRARNQDHRGTSMKVLSFITMAHRPLVLKELQHALGTHEGDRDFDEANYYRGTRIPSIATGLISVADGDDNAIVQFSHPSLATYLKRTADTWFPLAEMDMANACLAYLNFDSFSTPCKDIEEFRSKESRYPFIAYASQHWGDHVRSCGASPKLENSALRLLDQPLRLAASIQAAAWSSNPWGSDTWNVWQGIIDLHVIAWYGLSSIFDGLVRERQHLEVNARDELFGRTPLMYSCKQGHAEITRRLLFRGAGINDVSKRGDTALSEAIHGNREEVLKILISHKGIAVNAVHTAEQNRTGLMLAASQGQSNIVEMLLSHSDIDVNFQDSNGDTALGLAAEAGSKETIQALLRKTTIDINRVNDRGWSALYIAAKEDSQESVELLLENNADSSRKDKDFQATAILRATDFGWYGVVDLMLNYQSVDIQCTDMNGRGLFHSASANGHTEIVKLLANLEELDPNSQDKDGCTPLHDASRVGSLEVVQALIEIGVAKETKDHHGRTPFQVACENGNVDIASLLAGKSFTELESSLPIWALVKSSHSGLVTQAIAERKRDVFERDPESGYTAVHWAVIQDEIGVLRMLLDETDLSPNSTDKIHRTPLHLAAINNRLEASEILLDHRAEVNPRDKWDALPIQLAYENNNFTIAVALIEKGAKVENIDIQKVFFTAVELGKIKAVQILLDHGADILAQATDGRTAIEIAKDTDFPELIRILYSQETFKNPKSEEKPVVTQARRVRRKRALPSLGDESNKRLAMRP